MKGILKNTLYMKKYYKINYWRNKYFQFDQHDKPHKPDNFTPNENIDRIKLPCFCTYEWRGKRRLGMLANINYKMWGIIPEEQNPCSVHLLDMSRQCHRLVGSMVMTNPIKELIEDYKINIGKVEINYYEVI